MRPSSLPFLVVAFVACIGDDPTPSGSRGTSGTSGTSGSSGTVSVGINCDGLATCKGTQKCCGVARDWIGSACKADCGGAVELACDDATDCGSGLVCCSQTDGGARTTKSYCKASCAPTEPQLCSLSGTTECAAPTTCSPYTMWSPNGIARCK